MDFLENHVKYEAPKELKTGVHALALTRQVRVFIDSGVKILVTGHLNTFPKAIKWPKDLSVIVIAVLHLISQVSTYWYISIPLLVFGPAALHSFSKLTRSYSRPFSHLDQLQPKSHPSTTSLPNSTNLASMNQ
jgi:hypothetical protein